MDKRRLFLCIFVKIFLFFCGVILFFTFAEVALRIWLYKKPPLRKVIDSNPMPLTILIPNTEGWYRGSHVKLNSKGLRDKEYPVNKNNDVFRIFVLGKCPVIGFGVESEETYPKQLEALLNKNKAARGNRRYEVINGGLVGGMLQHEVIKFFREEGIKYNPDMLIFEWDIELGAAGWWQERKLRHSPLWVDFVFFKIIPMMPKELYFTRFLSNRLGDYRLKIYWEEIIKDKGGEVNYINKRYSELGIIRRIEKVALKQLFEFVQAKKIPVLVVILPWLNYFDQGHPFQHLYSSLINTCNSYNVKTLNLFDEFKAMNPSDLWLSYKERRPNSSAYGIIASAIYKKLLEEGFLR